jgi:hypothetical protein
MVMMETPIERESRREEKAKEGVKFDDGKLRYDLVPPYPLNELVKVYTVGAKKYSDRNWEKGMSWGRIFAALMRHCWAFWNGEENDPEDGIHHMAHAAWCCLALIEYGKTHKELDDRNEIHK